VERRVFRDTPMTLDHECNRKGNSLEQLQV